MKRLLADYKKEYTFDELDKEVQDEVIEKMMGNDIEVYNDCFQLDCNEQMKEKFPNSDVSYTYSLSYSQGDGFGLYGFISVEDILNLTNINLTDIEKDMFNDLCDGETRIYNDRHSTFFNKEMIDLAETYDEDEINYVLENNWNNVDTSAFDIKTYCKKAMQIETKLRNILFDFCKKMEKEGYDSIYVVEGRNDIIEEIIANDYRFDVNGNIL